MSHRIKAEITRLMWKRGEWKKKRNKAGISSGAVDDVHIGPDFEALHDAAEKGNIIDVFQALKKMSEDIDQYCVELKKAPKNDLLKELSEQATNAKAMMKEIINTAKSCQSFGERLDEVTHLKNQLRLVHELYYLNEADKKKDEKAEDCLKVCSPICKGDRTALSGLLATLKSAKSEKKNLKDKIFTLGAFRDLKATWERLTLEELFDAAGKVAHGSKDYTAFKEILELCISAHPFFPKVEELAVIVLDLSVYEEVSDTASKSQRVLHQFSNYLELLNSKSLEPTNFENIDKKLNEAASLKPFVEKKLPKLLSLL